METLKPKASEEQVLYSKILNAGMLIGLTSLIVCFILYITGVLTPLIPLEDVTSYWKLSVHDYLSESGVSAGWSWINNLSYGDMLNYLPIAFLSLLTILCYLALLPKLVKKKDKAYLAICLIEIIVLAVAASGILGTGGH